MKHIVSFSGGKESTAMLLRMLELKMQVDEIMFCDFGLEYPEVYNYVKKIEKFIGRKITIIKPKKSWDDLFFQKMTKGKYKGETKGFPWVVTRGCWASRDLKLRPMQKFQKKEDIIYLGINVNEKRRIQTEKGKCENLRYPLVDWNWDAQDCIDYLKKKNLFPPLYNKFKRLGCWLCPKQSLKALQILFEDYPDLWKKLKYYEKKSPHGFKPNFKLKDFEKKIKNQTK